MEKYCRNCGAKLDDNASFCGECGVEVMVEEVAITNAQIFTSKDKKLKKRVIVLCVLLAITLGIVLFLKFGKGFFVVDVVKNGTTEQEEKEVIYRIVKETCVDVEITDEDESYQIENEYDANGNKIKYVKYASNDENSIWKEYVYDENGNQIEGIEYEMDGQIDYRYVNLYDDNGNCIERIVYGKESEVYIPVRSLTQFVLKLIDKTTDGGFGNLTIDNRTVGFELTIDCRSRHSRIVSFEVTYAFFQVVIQLSAHAGISPTFRDKGIKTVFLIV